MKAIAPILTLILAFTLHSNVNAQRMQRGGGEGPPNRGQARDDGQRDGQRGGQRDGQRDGQRGGQRDGQRGGQFGQGVAGQGMNQFAGQNMPSPQAMAQQMVANFDTDGSGELGQAELVNALMVLRQLMINQGNGQLLRNGQRQMGMQMNQQNGLGGNANRQVGQQNQQPGQGARQARGNRLPGRGRGGR